MPQEELGYYAGAFHQAARTLMRSLRRRGGFSNVAAAPLLFMYRHAIELYLKAIIVAESRSIVASSVNDEKLFKTLGTHKLLPLIARVEELFNIRGLVWWWPNPLVETFANVYDLVAYIESIDPDGFAFRYPVDRSGRRSIATDLQFGFDRVVSALDALAEALDTVDFGLAVERVD